jgi:hypothetical protein
VGVAAGAVGGEGVCPAREDYKGRHDGEDNEDGGAGDGSDGCRSGLSVTGDLVDDGGGGGGVVGGKLTRQKMLIRGGGGAPPTQKSQLL